MASTILSDNGVSSGSAGIKSTADSTGALALQTTTAGGAATTAVTIDTSQNVGIGTSSPAGKLDVSQSTAGVARHYLRNTSNSVGAYTILDLVNDSGNNIGEFFCTSSTNTSAFGTNATVLQAATSNPLILGTNGTERMRIDPSGNLLVNTTTNSVSSKFVFYSASGTIGACQSGVSTAVTQIAFVNTNGTVGSITTNGSATAYNTSSDYRLKNTIAPMTGALAKVQALKPVTYKWNVDDSGGEGFIAHELAEVCPHAVSGKKDAVDDDGNHVYQGIDVSFLVATLTAAIQEQQVLITSLTARITALEAQTADNPQQGVTP